MNRGEVLLEMTEHARDSVKKLIEALNKLQGTKVLHITQAKNEKPETLMLVVYPDGYTAYADGNRKASLILELFNVLLHGGHIDIRQYPTEGDWENCIIYCINSKYMTFFCNKKELTEKLAVEYNASVPPDKKKDLRKVKFGDFAI